MIAARAASAGRRGPSGPLLVALPVGLVATLVIWPIIVAVLSTVRIAGPGGTEWSVASYRFFFTDGYSLRNLGVTLWTVAVSTAILMALSLPLAIYLRFTRSRAAGVVQALALFPLFVPSFIFAYAFIRVLSPFGMADILLAQVGLPRLPSPYLTPWGPVIGFVWDNIPLAVLILGAGLANVSETEVEAARDVGAGRGAILARILMPRIWPSMLVAASFVVLGLFTAWTFPFLLGPAAPEMMGPFMLRTFSDVQDPVQARTQAVVTFLFCAAFGWFYVRSVIRNRRAP